MSSLPKSVMDWKLKSVVQGELLSFQFSNFFHIHQNNKEVFLFIYVCLPGSPYGSSKHNSFIHSEFNFPFFVGCWITVVKVYYPCLLYKWLYYNTEQW